MKKLISSILLVSGTSVGGGMLLLPAVIGVYGYFTAVVVLISLWLLTVITAHVFLEASCYLPAGTSLISISRKLLGPKVEWIVWIITLVFLYSLLCVYISGTIEVLAHFFNMPTSTLAIITAALTCIPMYFGISHVSFFNNFLVIGMFLAFFGISFFIIPNISIVNILSVPLSSPIIALPIVFTAFGFLNMIPTIRTYLDDDIKKVRLAIIIGSGIPLLVYIMWISIVMGVLPFFGDSGLQMIASHSEPIVMLKTSLLKYSSGIQISIYIQIFVFFAMISSYVAISLALFDFLADGLKLPQNFKGKVILLVLTFLPPLVITLLKSKLFLSALGFAGMMYTILFCVYPFLLTWIGRNKYNLEPSYTFRINRFFSFVVILACLGIITTELFLLIGHS